MKSKKIKCPCCGFYTLEDEGEEVIVDICPVCYWQYDIAGQKEPNIAVGGPNRDVSLNQARENYIKFGAYHKDLVQYVRKPIREEVKD